jgi:hypothetical protein
MAVLQLILEACHDGEENERCVVRLSDLLLHFLYAIIGKLYVEIVDHHSI